MGANPVAHSAWHEALEIIIQVYCLHVGHNRHIVIIVPCPLLFIRKSALHRFCFKGICPCLFKLRKAKHFIRYNVGVHLFTYIKSTTRSPGFLVSFRTFPLELFSFRDKAGVWTLYSRRIKISFHCILKPNQAPTHLIEDAFQVGHDLMRVFP